MAMAIYNTAIPFGGMDVVKKKKGNDDGGGRELSDVVVIVVVAAAMSVECGTNATGADDDNGMAPPVTATAVATVFPEEFAMVDTAEDGRCSNNPTIETGLVAAVVLQPSPKNRFVTTRPIPTSVAAVVAAAATTADETGELELEDTKTSSTATTTTNTTTTTKETTLMDLDLGCICICLTRTSATATGGTT
jgi:hypothetical protein